MKKIVLFAQGVQPRVVELIAAERGVVVANDIGALMRELQSAHALVIQDPA